MTFTGVARHVSSNGREHGETCGVELDGSLEAWQAAIEGRLYPNTTRTGSADGLWELYVDSGYFNISGKDEARFQAVRQAFSETTGAVGRSPEVAACVVWPSSRGVEAAMTMARPYLGSWVAYQLARRQDDPPRAGDRAPRAPGDPAPQPGACLARSRVPVVHHLAADPCPLPPPDHR